MSTGIISKNELKEQCLYHIKSLIGFGFWQCQGTIDHEPGKHILPKSSPPHGIVETIGPWYPTFEEAHRAYKNENNR